MRKEKKKKKVIHIYFRRISAKLEADENKKKREKTKKKKRVQSKKRLVKCKKKEKKKKRLESEEKVKSVSEITRFGVLVYFDRSTLVSISRKKNRLWVFYIFLATISRYYLRF